MEAEQEAMEEAELLVDTALHRPQLLLRSSKPHKSRSLHEKLLEIYIEESRRERQCQMLKPNSYLLDKLVKKERLNTLVVNLYSGNEGYTLMLRGKGGSECETIRLPYEESEILDYIDEEQLPPLIVDVLDKAQVNVFYSGCVVAEIRDHRRSTDAFDTRYVLLHPTAQSLHCDMNALMSNHPQSTWTQDDVHQLESQLLLRTQAPLCLDPSPSVSLVANKLNYARSRFNTRSLRRAVKKYSQVSINRKRKMSTSRAPKHLFLHDFIQRRKDKSDPSLQVNLKVSKTDAQSDRATQSVDMWQQREVHLTVPETIDVPKYAKVIERPKLTRDNSLIVVEEYTFETERSHGKVNYSRLVIVQRLSDEFFLGELYVDRDYVEAQSKGSTCKFNLGTKHSVEKYIRQFREIFTEEGRRQVKITHKVPGQTPTISYTQPLPLSTATPSLQPANTNHNPTLLAQAASLAANLTVQNNPRPPNAFPEARKGVPIRLSLALNTPGIIGGKPQQGAPLPGQLTVNVQPSPQIHINRGIRQIGIYSGPRSSERPSPASTPTSSTHLPSYTQAMGTSSGPPTPSTPTDANFLSPTGGHMTHIPSNQHIAPPPNVNIANITSLGPNINIQNLQNLQGIKNLSNIHGLPANAQVSISLGNSSNASSLTVPLSVINSVTGGQATPGQSILVNAPASANHKGLASPQTFVTMVTAIPSSASTPTSSTTGCFSQQMLSVPIGSQGNLSHIMAATGMKGGGPNLKPGTPLLLSQIPGQPPVQLLSNLNRSAHTKHGLTSPPLHHPGAVQLGGLHQLRPSVANSPQLMRLGGQSPQLTHIALQQQTMSRSLHLSQASRPKSKKVPGSTPPKA